MTLQSTRPRHSATTASADADLLFQEAHRRRRRRRIITTIVAVMAIGATSAAVALTSSGKGHARPPVATRPLPHPTVALPGAPPRVAWVDYQGQVHIGSLRTHQQGVVASGAAPGEATISMVASGKLLFWDSGTGVAYDTVMAYDTATGRVRSFASGVQVFRAVDSTDVFVVSIDGRQLARYGLDGRLVKRLPLPDRWYLPDPFGLGTSSPALANGGILVQSQSPVQAETNGAPPTRLAVWTPATGKFRVLGDFSFPVATYTNALATTSLVAWLPHSCETSFDTCSVHVTDLATGVTRQIRNPLGFGFDTRGAFSPDGRQLAAFAKTNSGNYNPETRLALIDVATGTLRAVPGATIAIGEAIAWAQWLPASSRLIVGGTSGQDGSGTWEANHFLVDSTTLRSTPFSFLTDGQRDVNYSAVLLP
jgi:hypothetical protein